MDDLRHGQGKQTLPSGDVIIGTWQYDNLHGYAIKKHLSYLSN